MVPLFALSILPSVSREVRLSLMKLISFQRGRRQGYCACIQGFMLLLIGAVWSRKGRRRLLASSMRSFGGLAASMQRQQRRRPARCTMRAVSRHRPIQHPQAVVRSLAACLLCMSCEETGQFSCLGCRDAYPGLKQGFFLPKPDMFFMVREAFKGDGQPATDRQPASASGLRV